MIRDIPSTLRHSRTYLEPVCDHSFVAWTLSACCGGSRYEGDVGWLEDGGGCSVVTTEIVTHPLVLQPRDPYSSFYDTSFAWRVPRQRRGASGDGAPARVRLASTIVREGLGSASCSKG